ncbi:hypothetical protein [Rhizobium sp. Root708]|uniref:hypothetical protein n=1 Tax=Rhizobium sp. Root708 TaxID=1736592 RepID=UPI000A6BA957|nr:hypothetical protein [Rhizobium sp. Root708]
MAKIADDPVEATARSPGERKTKRKAAKFVIILIAGVALAFFFLYLCIIVWAAFGSH